MNIFLWIIQPRNWNICLFYIFEKLNSVPNYRFIEEMPLKINQDMVSGCLPTYNMFIYLRFYRMNWLRYSFWSQSVYYKDSVYHPWKRETSTDRSEIDISKYVSLQMYNSFHLKCFSTTGINRIASECWVKRYYVLNYIYTFFYNFLLHRMKYVC